MEYWIVYDIETGQELYTGSGDRPGLAAFQSLPEGAGLVVVPQVVVATMPRDLSALKTALTAGIDNTAEQVRSRFITALPGQVGTYWLKAEVARRWLADNAYPTVGLASEAESRGMTIADLANEVLANEEAWLHIADAIEGLRFKGKIAIANAATIGAIVAAANVNWESVNGQAA